MIHAYNSIYLENFSKNLGNMLQDAVVSFGFDGEDFLAMFIQSDIAEEIENGNVKFIAGMSGIELFYEVVERTTDVNYSHECVENFDRSDAYWTGWVLAHYQWYSAKSFKDILDVISYDDFICLYKTLHEADITKVYDVLDEHFKRKEPKLKRVRNKSQMTQKELSKESGVSLNTIRAYERKSKDINKAQVDIIYRLTDALKCDISDIID